MEKIPHPIAIYECSHCGGLVKHYTLSGYDEKQKAYFKSEYCSRCDQPLIERFNKYQPI